jgi:hypothetical protein
MKPTKDFRLSKESKRALSIIIDKNMRGGWKNMLIEAELAEKKAKLAKIKEPKGE